MNLTVTTQGVFPSESAIDGLMTLLGYEVKNDGPRKIFRKDSISSTAAATLAQEFINGCSGGYIFETKTNMKIDGDGVHLTIHKSLNHALFD